MRKLFIVNMRNQKKHILIILGAQRIGEAWGFWACLLLYCYCYHYYQCQYDYFLPFNHCLNVSYSMFSWIIFLLLNRVLISTWDGAGFLFCLWLQIFCRTPFFIQPSTVSEATCNGTLPIFQDTLWLLGVCYLPLVIRYSSTSRSKNNSHQQASVSEMAFRALSADVQTSANRKICTNVLVVRYLTSHYLRYCLFSSGVPVKFLRLDRSRSA